MSMGSMGSDSIIKEGLQRDPSVAPVYHPLKAGVIECCEAHHHYDILTRTACCLNLPKGGGTFKLWLMLMQRTGQVWQS